MPHVNIIHHLKRALAQQDAGVPISDEEIARALSATPKLPKDIEAAFIRQGNPVDSVLRRRRAQPDYEWPIAANRSGGGSKKK